MKIIDISQEILSCRVYEGDPVPQGERIADMKKGGTYNLSTLSMCAHNGTHVDAPLHFYEDGKSVDQMSLEHFVGECFVAEASGSIGSQEAYQILEKANALKAQKRILIKGEAVVTEEAARVFADEGVLLVGNESQTVGPEDAPMQVHLTLLGAGVVLLEGVRLQAVPEGAYHLSAAPISLGGADGAPCRAYLIDVDLPHPAAHARAVTEM